MWEGSSRDLMGAETKHHSITPAQQQSKIHIKKSSLQAKHDGKNEAT
jgi:hypothetical protein